MMETTTTKEHTIRRTKGAAQVQTTGGAAGVDARCGVRSGESVRVAGRKRSLSKGPGYGRYTDREWALMEFGRHVTMARDWLREAAKDHTQIGKESCVRYARYAGRKARAAYAAAFPRGKSDAAQRVPTSGKGVAAC